MVGIHDDLSTRFTETVPPLSHHCLPLSRYWISVYHVQYNDLVSKENVGVMNSPLDLTSCTHWGSRTVNQGYFVFSKKS